MSDQIRSAIDSLYSEMEILNKRMAEIKKSINNLSVINGEEPPFKDLEFTTVVGTNSIRPDQYFGKGLATAVKEYLKARGRAATVQEIYDALRSGGFEFTGTKGEKIQMRNLAISLSKNSTDFVYVKSSNAYGLWEFYPEKKREREKKKIANGENSNNSDDVKESTSEKETAE